MIDRGINNGAPYSIAVIDDDPRVRTRLAMQVGEVARAAAFGSLDAIANRSDREGTVLVLGPSFTQGDHLDEVGRVTRSRPDVTAVMVVNELSTAVLQQAMRAGIADVITLPPEPGQLQEAIERAAESISLAPIPVSVDVEAGPAEPGAGVITVFSMKGGAGKSFIAANLAVLLARRNEKPVALVDADLQFGDAAVMLKLTPQHTIVDAVQAIDRLDAELLRSLLIRHEPSGLLVLPAPLEPAFAEQVGPPDIRRIVEILQSFCSHIVIDTPAYFTDVVLGILESSHQIVLVASMDVPNIKNVKIGLQTLRLLNVPPQKLKLVLNRANSRVKLEVGEVERTLGLKADSLVPSDIVVPQSINKGVPVVLDAPRSGVTHSLERLADLLTVSSR